MYNRKYIRFLFWISCIWTFGPVLLFIGLYDLSEHNYFAVADNSFLTFLYCIPWLKWTKKILFLFNAISFIIMLVLNWKNKAEARKYIFLQLFLFILSLGYTLFVLLSGMFVLPN